MYNLGMQDTRLSGKEVGRSLESCRSISSGLSLSDAAIPTCASNLQYINLFRPPPSTSTVGASKHPHIPLCFEQEWGEKELSCGTKAPPVLK